MTQTLLLPPTAVPTSTLGGRHDTQQLIRITSPRWPRSVPLLGRQLNILGRVIVCIVWINVPILLALAFVKGDMLSSPKEHTEQSYGLLCAIALGLSNAIPPTYVTGLVNVVYCVSAADTACVLNHYFLVPLLPQVYSQQWIAICWCDSSRHSCNSIFFLIIYIYTLHGSPRNDHQNFKYSSFKYSKSLKFYSVAERLPRQRSLSGLKIRNANIQRNEIAINGLFF